MQNLRRFSLLLLGVALLVPWATAEKPATLPAPTGYIDDYASVLSPEAKAQMATLCRELHDKTRAQAFVVTVNSLEGESVERFANDLFHRWKIGEKKTDRGALLLFAIQDHKYRIEVGYGLEGILNDAKVGDIGRTMVPDLKAAQYDNAVTLGLHGVVQVIADDAKVQLDALAATPASADQITSVSDDQAPDALEATLPPLSRWASFLAILPIILSCSVIALMIGLWIRAGLRQKSGAGGSSGWTSNDSDSSSGSSFSDDSSSSDSFSGGDGGDSGGGGASGGW